MTSHFHIDSQIVWLYSRFLQKMTILSIHSQHKMISISRDFANGVKKNPVSPRTLQFPGVCSGKGRRVSCAWTAGWGSTRSRMQTTISAESTSHPNPRNVTFASKFFATLPPSKGTGLKLTESQTKCSMLPQLTLQKYLSLNHPYDKWKIDLKLFLE